MRKREGELRGLLENLKATEKDVSDIVYKLDIVEGRATQSNKVWELDEDSFQALKAAALELGRAHKSQQHYEYYTKMIDELLNAQDVR